MTGDGGGSYDTDMQSFDKKAQGKVYKKDIEDYSGFYNNEQP